MFNQAFYRHGRLCASHPWEVIVVFLTLAVCMISMSTIVTGSRLCSLKHNCIPSPLDGKGPDAVIMTATRCFALLYIYHQFRKLYKYGSKYLVGIAGLFTVFSSFVFSSSVVNFLEGNFSELNEALPFFLLLIDLSKAGQLAQFALSSCSQQEVQENIARGMAVLGPSITLDTIVETLVIGVGTISGVKRLEEMSCFACLSALVNYLVFMTFFPACLSLVLELARERGDGQPSWQLGTLKKVLMHEQEHKPNPVLQRVKIIMSAGLLVVHAHSRWPLGVDSSELDRDHPFYHQPNLVSREDDSNLFLQDSYFAWTRVIERWVILGTEQLLMFVLAGSLIVKYIFFETGDDFKEHLSRSNRSSSCSLHQHYEALEKNDSLSALEGKPGCSCEGLKFRRSYRNSDQVRSRPRFFLGGEYEVPEMATVGVQTEIMPGDENQVLTDEAEIKVIPERTVEECLRILNEQEEGCHLLTDDEVLQLLKCKHIAPYKLETILKNPERGVAMRRKHLSQSLEKSDAILGLPFLNYDYAMVHGACCENVIGYVPIPVGIAGPLLLDDKKYHVPMATTEGCLVASTNRGCRALFISGGVRSSLVADSMTRGPVLKFPNAQNAAMVMNWLNEKENFAILKEAFDSTSRFARLDKLQVRIAGRHLYIRFMGKTGDAMGMNMISKGTEFALKKLQEIFPSAHVLSLSGNYCTDKKPAAINWIEGRGKSVVCEAEIPSHVIKNVLKTDVKSLIEVNISKNLVGSAMAGSIGGFNAQAANVVTAIYIATGQDPAQNVGSSNCITLMEACGPTEDDLYISCTMPSIEIGTVGGGTILPPQAACLDMLGVRGACAENPGQNAATLARIVCGTVMAGELSLMSALTAGHLVRSHMTHNRSQISMNLPKVPIVTLTDCGSAES